MVQLVAKQLRAPCPWPRAIGDYRIFYDYSRQIVQTGIYPPLYYYAPPSVALMFCTTFFPFSVSAGIWVGLSGAAAIGSWLILIVMLRIWRTPGAMACLPLIFLGCSSFFSWDLTKQNMNVFFLGMLLVGVWFLDRDRPIAAGGFIAVSFALKLFSVLVIPYLFWKRRYRAFAWTIVFCVVYWILLPPIIFGPRAVVGVYRNWGGGVLDATRIPTDFPHPLLISIQRGAAYLAPGQPVGSAIIVDAVRAAWLGGLILICGTWQKRDSDVREARALIADIGALVLAAIGPSPYLEPYHPVAFAACLTVLLAVAADVNQTPRRRTMAGVFLVVVLILAGVPSRWELRGLAINIRLLIGSVGAILSTRALARQCETTNVKTLTPSLSAS